MATKNYTLSFTPSTSLPVPVNVKFQFKSTGGMLLNEQSQVITSVAPAQVVTFNGVTGVPDNDADLVITALVQDGNGNWQDAFTPAGVEVSPDCVLSFDGWQIGVS